MDFDAEAWKVAEEIAKADLKVKPSELIAQALRRAYEKGASDENERCSKIILDAKELMRCE